ncbi:Zinc finger HIT domain-containing protein 1 [Madurella fahalii]|uniref:Zinc finger HIT domain-containing protein 1 n=1 Tax=Madurella fahalii TaxID=1157608 RepID=A0ABQ0FZM0_9PEZI
MNNFGVIEIASTTTKSTPGWAYVPDTGPALPAALQPANRKRAARNQPALSLSDLSARQETKIRKDLEALDRDNHRDISIPIPPKAGGSSRGQNKHTPNVRKILQSQKTFANHLDDYQALLALAETNPAAAAAMNAAQAKPSTPTTATAKSASPAPTQSSSTAGGASKRSAAAAKRAAAKEKQEQEKERKRAKQTPKPGSQEPPEPQPQPKPAAAAAADDDVEMLDAPASAATTTSTPAETATEPPNPQSYPRESLILPPYRKPPPRPHPGDADPLLVSRVPPFPTDEELRALMTAPPLSYLEARATWDDDGEGEGEGGRRRRYPPRAFCAVCGYWGRVKCMRCGTRCCALECLTLHGEECVGLGIGGRYGL